MIDLTERAKTLSIVNQSIDAKYKDKLTPKERHQIIIKLLKSLIKYKANHI
jgi:hypothetical protein